MSLKVLAAGVLGGCLLVASSAVAQAPPPPVDDASKEEAKRLYRDGQTNYDLGEYNVAVEKFKGAYKAYQDPAFLYNIAQSYRMLNNYGEAISFYKSFLRKKSDVPAKTRAQIESRIQELEKLSSQSRTQAEKPPTGVSPPSLSLTPTEPPPAGATTPPAPAPGGSTVPAGGSLSPAGASAPAGGATLDKLPEAPKPDGSNGAAATISAPPAPEPEQPIYMKKWVWGAAGGVVVAVVLIAILASSGGGSIPQSTLGGDIGPGVKR